MLKNGLPQYPTVSMPEWECVQLKFTALQPLMTLEDFTRLRISSTSVLVMPTISAESQMMPSSPPQSIHTAWIYTGVRMPSILCPEPCPAI